ncbi:MAG: sigma-70 family RNA polymerase sigma factor [Firmicutes bacterium]|nr:sigma-70 family RNA polymerase sigma factor [Bacillota bacterium]MDD4693710.1 sigma-70 family RNA polymerase sigma factor [Bacillota bacterium]
MALEERLKDHSLVQKLKAGDDEAYDCLCTEYSGKMYRLVCRLAGSDDAEDLVQEAFMQIYKSMSSFRGDCSISTWVYRITTNVCQDYLRRKSRRSWRHLFSLDWLKAETNRELPSTDLEPHEQAEVRDDMDKLRLAIAALPPEQKAVLVLHDLEQLTYQEVADVLGIVVGTVKSRLFYARKKVRSSFEGGVQK